MRLGRSACPALAAIALVAASAGNAHAAECPSVETSQAFSRWGDGSEYALVPGGTFEEGMTWSASGPAQAVATDNPLDITGESTASALLETSASITSPSLCIDRSYPHLRFAARAPDGAATQARLTLAVAWTDAFGRVNRAYLGGYQAMWYGGWSVSDVVDLRRAVPLDERIRDIRLTFKVEAWRPGKWLIDDILIDPYKRG
jgi:hypothetical protein